MTRHTDYTTRDWQAWWAARHFHDDDCYDNGCDIRSGQLIETRAERDGTLGP